MPETAGDKYRAVRATVETAALRAGRNPVSVGLVAVTKTVDADRVKEAFEAGARTFGENYVQEAQGKVDRLPRGADWHMIGHLQSNKARRAVELFSCVQTLDRPSLAKALEKEARTLGTRLDALIQVNVAGETTKNGASPEETVALARRAPDWPHLRIRGLMAIPPYRPDIEDARADFRAVRELRDRIANLELPGVEMTELSMGMSHDFEVAIEEGATWVRVGSAIFGAR